MQQESSPSDSCFNQHGATSSNDFGTLPTYEEANNPNAPPPSYDSLFGRMRETRKTSTGMLDFFKNMFVLLLGTIGCTIILGISFVVPLTMMAMGTIYLYDCPVSEYIPIYLIVGGTAYPRAVYMKTAIKGFESCGLWPCDRHKICDEEYVVLKEDEESIKNADPGPSTLNMSTNVNKSSVSSIRTHKEIPSLICKIPAKKSKTKLEM